MKILSAKTRINHGRRVTKVAVDDDGVIRIAVYIGRIPNYLKTAA